ncbi:unnamed protein product [Orchesella dallaii]|uniref:Tudor domain-containing protein n=1 Tax=Orchesella dallaii TaxID=48710 RepID=A0ABP1RT71_9HEXA
MSETKSRHFGRGRGQVLRRMVEDKSDSEEEEQTNRKVGKVSTEVERNRIAPPEMNEADEELQRLNEFLDSPLMPPGHQISRRGGFPLEDSFRIRHNINSNENRIQNQNYNEGNPRDLSAYSNNQGTRRIPVPLLESNTTGSIENKVCEHEIVTTHYYCDPSKPAFRVCIKCFGTPCATNCENCSDAEKKQSDTTGSTDGSTTKNDGSNRSPSERRRHRHRHSKNINNVEPKSGWFRRRPANSSFQENIMLANQEQSMIERLKSVTFQTPNAEEEASGNEDEKSDLDDTQALEQTDSSENFLQGLQNQQFIGQGIGVPKKLAAGIPLKVKVVAVIQPACIFVQTEQQRRLIDVFKAKLKNEDLRRLEMKDIFEGQYVAVAHGGEFYRAQIEAIDVKLQLRVRLVDCAVTFVKPLSSVHELKAAMTKINRQVVSLNLTGIQATNSKEWKQEICNFLKNRLVGKSVSLIITHQLDGFPQHYCGSLTLCNETITVSEELIREKLANQAPDNSDILQYLVRPLFPDFQPPRFERNEKSKVHIVNVVSPEEFYVRKRNSRNVEELMRTFSGSVVLGKFADVFHDGTRMCLAFHPQRQREMVRAYCKEIDFMVEPEIATVYLIDMGITCQVPLNDLNEYSNLIQEFPPQVYCVGIAAQSANSEWSVEVTESLLEIMTQSEKGREIVLTCVDKDKNRSIVRMHVYGCSSTWEVGLKQVGTALSLSKSDDQDDLDTMYVSADPTFELLEFRQSTCPLTECSKRNDSPYSFKRIPPAEIPKEGVPVETRRIKGVYLYLLMTPRNYEIYKKLRQHCSDFAHTENAEPRGYNFVIGDVVLAKINEKTYLRCCITDFEEINGVKWATLMAFDIGKPRKTPISGLKCPDDLIMQTEILSHVVWLEGTDEDTLVLSKELTESIDPYCQHTTLKKLTKLNRSGTKLMVRLETSSAKGKPVLLSNLIKQFTQWDWERYFNAGFLTEGRLIRKLYEVTNFKWDPYKFVKEGAKMQAGTHRVQIRQTIISDKNPDSITIEVIPTSEYLRDDFNLLKLQMKDFYYKVILNNENASPDSPTYPHMVLLQETDDAKAQHKLGSPCEGHRCFLINEQIFKCVDCFQETKVNGAFDPVKLFKFRGLDIREICPEMLKVPPIGKRLSIKLPLPHNIRGVKPFVHQCLMPGREVEVQIAPQEPIADEEFLSWKTDAVLMELKIKLNHLRQSLQSSNAGRDCSRNRNDNP